jgi:RHS repeat-associated protein
MTERWTRDGTNIDEAVTSYSSQPNASPRTITITLPNGAKSVQYSYNLPGDFKDGLVYQDQTRDAADNILQSSVVTWHQGAYLSPRPSRVEATNERQQTTATDFSYGSVYNQVTEVKNYDYGGTTLLRATRTQYQNSVNYTSRHIFNLPLVVEVFAGDDVTRVSRTDYQYDGQTLTNTPDVVMHYDSHNPYAPEYLVSPGTCCEYDYYYVNCITYCPDYWTTDYNPATDYRGNVTQATTYADAVNLTGAVTETRRYDITGNLVTTSSACCEQTSFSYTDATQYAYPISQTRGSASDQLQQIITSAAYDFNTGLVLSATDANGRMAETIYFADSLRPQTARLSSGGHTDYTYDDGSMKVTQTTYLQSHPTHTTIADQNEMLLNGRGQVHRERALGAGSVWDIVDVEYDPMGQVIKRSQPYRTGTPLWTHFTYDALGRTRKVIAPDYTLADASDGSTTETFYNEVARPTVASALPGETTRVRDAWGRERWGRTDAQGRLVEVVEPNPSGNGSVFVAGALLTNYTYNTLGSLTQTTHNAHSAQDIQTRLFKYDSLGRLTAQKLAETNATLNDAGVYQTSGNGTWGDVFTYDDRSNLISRIDARGVKTIYSYSSDPLNRLQSVSWDTNGFGDTVNPILPAGSVSYQYRTKSSGSQLLDITQLISVTTAGVSTEIYSYDTEGRVSTKTLTLASRASYPFVTDYIYDDLDRLENVRYPAEYGNGSQPRKLVHHNYDVASRLSSLTVDAATHASQVVYNAASQTTSLSVGASGPNQIVETYSYEQHTGLLANQTIARAATPTNYLLDLSYDYAGPGGKRTGQLVKLLNNKNHNKDRSYNYDALGRLAHAHGGPSGTPLWTQTYAYDNFGNRTTVTANGNSAKNRGSGPIVRDTLAQISETGSADVSSVVGNQRLVNQAPEKPKLSVMTAEPARNTHHTSRAARPNTPNPQSGPPNFTDPDLLAPGGVQIKTLHITELRTAINDLRIRLGMAAFSWQTSATSGGLIKADPIIEMQTALDQAIGPPPSPGYSPGLAPSQPILAIHIQELRDRVVGAWNASSQIPRDGHENLSYDLMNRITTTGFAYDKAGNQVRALKPGGGSHRFQYDAANRLVRVKADDGVTVLASYTYADSNQRLVTDEGNLRTYYTCDGKVEYTESGSDTSPGWSRSSVYLGARLLSTLSPNGSGGEAIQYHHPDRLGTRLVSNAQDTSAFEQVSLPFGIAISAESTGSTNRRFTSYDRSSTTGIDYAINRHYDPQQGRFTQVDPIGVNAANLTDPQSFNLYSYCGNDPINHVDPSGLFWGRLIRFLKKALRIINAILLTVAAILSPSFQTISAAVNAWIDVFGSPRLRGIAKAVNNLIQSIGVRVSSSGEYWQDPEGPPPDVVITTDIEAPGPWWDEFIKALSTSGINAPWLVGEWFTGGGPRSRKFDHKSKITSNLRTSPDLKEHIRRFCASGKKSYNSSKEVMLQFGGSGVDGPIRAGINEGRQFVGSYELRIRLSKSGSDALFVIKNETSLYSALYHVSESLKISRPGPLQTTTQYYWWFDPNPCKK